MQMLFIPCRYTLLPLLDPVEAFAKKGFTRPVR